MNSQRQEQKSAVQRLEQLGIALESRRASGKRGRLPDAVWGEAVELVDELDLDRVANALGLRREKLADRLAPSPARQSRARMTPVDSVATFVDVLPLLSSGTQLKTCALEIQSMSGSLIRIQLESPEVASLAALVRELLV